MLLPITAYIYLGDASVIVSVTGELLCWIAPAVIISKDLISIFNHLQTAKMLSKEGATITKTTINFIFFFYFSPLKQVSPSLSVVVGTNDSQRTSCFLGASFDVIVSEEGFYQCFRFQLGVLNLY